MRERVKERSAMATCPRRLPSLMPPWLNIAGRGGREVRPCPAMASQGPTWLAKAGQGRPWPAMDGHGQPASSSQPASDPLDPPFSKCRSNRIDPGAGLLLPVSARTAPNLVARGVASQRIVNQAEPPNLLGIFFWKHFLEF